MTNKQIYDKLITAKILLCEIQPELEFESEQVKDCCNMVQIHLKYLISHCEIKRDLLGDK
jgi:hypothetical protein